jgi:hypothetical protein
MSLLIRDLDSSITVPLFPTNLGKPPSNGSRIQPPTRLLDQ